MQQVILHIDVILQIVFNRIILEWYGNWFLYRILCYVLIFHFKHNINLSKKTKLNKLKNKQTLKQPNKRVENFKVLREHGRLETDMNVPSVDNNLLIRTLRSRNIPYDTRHRQIARKTSRGQKPNIPPRPNSLKTNSNVITPDTSTHLPNNKDETIGSTFRHECIQISIPTPRRERYIKQNTLRISAPHINSYDSNMKDRNTFTKPKISSLARDTFDHNKRENYEMCGDLRRDRDESEHISDRLCRTA